MDITPLQVAQHEAAHAVMRKICGMTATRLHLHDEGGFCAGTGKSIRADDELIYTLAGFAWETLEGYGPKIGSINLGMGVFGPEDFREAWEILETREHLRFKVKTSPTGEPKAVFDTVCGTLRRYFAMAMAELKPHRGAIERIGAILHEEGELSAKRVGALLRGVEAGRKVFEAQPTRRE